MKKLLIGLAAALLLGAGCSSNEPKPAKSYTCSMKCVTSEKPGPCPKCGMEMAEIQPGAPEKKKGSC